MNRSNKKLYILITIISLLIMFFLFPLNGYAAQLEDFAIPEYTTNLEYTGENVYLNDLTISYKGNTLVENDDYTISYNDDDYITLGTKTATITITNSDDACVFTNYTKTLEISYKVCISISDAEIEPLEGAEIEIDGGGNKSISFEYSTKTPPFNMKVQHEGTEYTLVYGTDFTVDEDYSQYSANFIFPSTARGIGDYAGEKEISVSLKPKSIRSNDIRCIPDSNAHYDESTGRAELRIQIYDDSISNTYTIDSGNYQIEYDLDVPNRKGTATITGINCYKDTLDPVEFDLATRQWQDSGFSWSITWDYTNANDEGFMYYSDDGLKPEITLTYDDGSNIDTLVEGTDYEIEINATNVEEGKFDLHIILKGNYIGGEFFPFTAVYKVTNDDPLLDLPEPTPSDYYIGQGAECSANPQIEYDNKELEKNTDYTVETVVKDKEGNIHYASNGNSGISNDDARTGNVFIVYVTVTFIGRYSGTVEYTYNLCPSIEDPDFVCLDEGARVDGNTIYYSYTGSVINPSFELVVNGNNLVYGTDFDLTRSEGEEDHDIEIGPDLVEDQEFVLKGINNYGGYAYVRFTIEAKSIESSDISFTTSNNCYVSTSVESSDAVTYECEIVLHDETRDYNLVKDEDFEVGYEEVDGKVIVNISGINNYTGNLERTISKATAKLKSDIVDITYDTDYNDYKAMYYTGSETHPEVKVAIGETELVLDTDYSVSYEAKSEYSYGSMVVLHIVGLNSFYGKLDYEYIIYSPLFEDLELPYEGTKKVSELLENNDLSNQFALIDNDIDISDCGEYEVTATLAKGYVFKVDDEYSLTGTFKITIVPLEITNDFEITIEDVRYTNEALKPTITIVDYNGNELEEDKDYTVTLENNTNVGHGNVLIKGKGNYSGEIEEEFNILGKSLESEDIKVTKDSNCYIDNENNYYFEISLYDETFDYTLVKDIDYEISFEQGINAVEFYITGIGNYAERLILDIDKASYLLTDDNITITYDEVTDENIMYLSEEETYPIVEIKYNDTLLTKGTDYNVSYDGEYAYNSIIKLNIKGVKDYYINYNSSFRIESQDKKVNEFIEDAATDIISSATKSADLDLDSINFEDLTGLSKDDLLKAKEYYNNLEQYIIDNKLDETVNKRLEEQGYSIRIEAADLASKLKDYLDKYATNAGYTNFNSQVDDVINALTVEEEKGNIKEELLAYVHKHITPGTLNPIHNSSSNQNENNKNNNEQINSLIDEQLESVKYEQCLDDSLRNDQLNDTIGQVHEIKNVSISIIKHTQKQTIANNNIEAYYNELVESGKYNEAQLALLKEVFDEMQEEVLKLLNDGNIDSQEELDKIVLKAIEKLSGVPITNLRAISEDGINVNISSSSGMASDTELKISYGAKNVSIAIGRAINNNNVSGKEDGILLIKNKEVKEAFDIDLIENGDVVKEFNGTYTIKILLTDELKAFNNLQIIYITSEGNVEVHDTYIEGDYLVFNTTHFSTYYLLGDKLFDFAPIIKILLAVIVSLIIFIVYLVLKIKKKKINQLGIISSLAFIPLSLVFSINVLVVCIILGIVAFILLVVAVLLAIKDYKIDRRINDEE